MSLFMSDYTAIICFFLFLVSSVLTPGVFAQNQCDAKSNDKVNVETATMFSVEYFDNYKLVTTNQDPKEILALYQCGTPPPTNLPAGAKLFQIPVKNVAVIETSTIPFLDILGYRSAIKLLDSSDLVSSPCVQLAKESGGVTILTTNQTFNQMQLSGVDLSFGANLNNPNDPKSISISSATDPGVLNRVEWIKFYSVFFNAETKGNEIYGKIKSNYECFKSLANKNSQSVKPIVAWTSFDGPSDFNKNTPAWKIADAVFKKQLTEDAGGSYFNSTTLSYATSTDFLKAIENVDILIDESFKGTTLDDVYKNYGLTADQQQYKFIKNQAIYREDGTVNPNDGRDWFESSTVMGDALLEDMINVINPKLPKPDYNRIWLRNVAKNEAIKISSSANCTEPDKPLTSKADDCTAISAKGVGAISSTPTFFSCFIAFIFVNLAIFIII